MKQDHTGTPNYSPRDARDCCSGPSHIGAVGLRACRARAICTEWLGYESSEGAPGRRLRRLWWRKRRSRRYGGGRHRTRLVSRTSPQVLVTRQGGPSDGAKRVLALTSSDSLRPCRQNRTEPAVDLQIDMAGQESWMQEEGSQSLTEPWYQPRKLKNLPPVCSRPEDSARGFNAAATNSRCEFSPGIEFLQCGSCDDRAASRDATCQLAETRRPSIHIGPT